MASPATTTSTVNLFLEPTPACSFAVSVAIDSLDYLTNEQELVIEPQSVSNPDVSGIGILIAFLATAYGVFIWMVLAYLCRWLPLDLLGRADEIVFKRRADRRSPWWKRASDQAILAFADQQIVTGIAILAAGFSRLQNLSVYHLHVIIYLAWMSSNTHLTAVSLLQLDFRSQKNPKLRLIRLMGMIILAVMLVVALVPTTGVYWNLIITNPIAVYDAAGIGSMLSVAPAVPARCFWQSPNSGGFQSVAAWSFIILVLSYTWKAMLLFKTSHRLFKITCRQYLQNVLTGRLDRIVLKLQLYRKPPPRLLTQYKLTLCTYLMVWTLFELAESFLVSLWICGGGLAWGSIQILTVRQMVAPEAQQEENTWGFGQLLPVLLLAVPITAFTEGYWSQKDSARKEISRTQGRCDQQRNGIEEGSRFLDTATKQTKDPQIANTAQQQSEGDVLLANDVTEELEQNSNSTQNRTRSIWKRDRDIYRSRLIRGFFWLSQINALCTIAMFCVLYVLGGPGDNVLFWTIVGGCIGGWLVVTVLWYVSGIFFSRLFDVKGLSRVEEVAMTPLGPPQSSPRRAPTRVE